ncbi:MAG: methionine--tRNA ligase [Spirochaetales bacterium]|nr:methionine--tRNA ligase [Spirochaetales bacterium]
MEKRLITSALPYVNNIPHLGNLIQVLSADVFARYCRLKGYDTLYICGTDEYGTATETKALEEGITPKEICDRYYKVHSEIYDWFNISFDKFGRTSTEKHTEITQHLFLKLEENGFIKEQVIQQTYCPKCERFLADRYVHGTCPACGYTEARGDQCENCGKLLDPTDLVDSRCGTCETKPEIRDTNHLFIDLPAIVPRLEKWMRTASVEGGWAKNAIQMTNAWIRDGVKLRCITRDLKWGIPVPRKGFEKKVFYVWFDAPIGYISITATLTDEWEKWWRNPENVNLFQFIGKDNIPFHSVIFPCTLLGSGEKWTLVHHLASSEYLNYESGKFSKSQGTGVFGTDAKDTGIPVDVWRFYIFYNRPEKADSMFTWKDFQEKVNAELIGNISNLVNRTLTFVSRFYEGNVPDGGSDSGFWKTVADLEKGITDSFEKVELREALRGILELSNLGNKRFQDAEPWKAVKEDKEKADSLLKDLVYLIRDLAVLLSPFIPGTSQEVFGFLGLKNAAFNDLGRLEGIRKLGETKLLFNRLEDGLIETMRIRFSGSQKERVSPKEKFRKNVLLKTARITQIEPHPKADKLYIETVDLGGETRTIVSGLVPYYREEELLDRTVILAANLQAAKLRGVESKGMLLAAEDKETVEVIFVEGAEPGTRIVLEGDDPQTLPVPSEINIDTFFETPMTIKEGGLFIEDTRLVCNGKPIGVSRVVEGKVR